MKVELSVYRRILRSVHAVRKRFSWSSDALFCVFGISASQAEFSAAGYGANMQEILHNCFMRPSITDDKHDKYSERLRAAFGLLRYLEQLHKHTELRQVAESREEFVEKTYQNVNSKERENDKTSLEQVENETEKESKETESPTVGRAESVQEEHADEEAQIVTAKQENLEQQEQKQENVKEEEKQNEQQKQEQNAAVGDDAIDTIDSPGTVVTNATLLLDYYNHQLIPLVMRVLLTPEEKIPSYAYMLPPEPFYAFEISERRSFAHIVDVLHVLSTVASLSVNVNATHTLNEHKTQTQQKNSHVEQKEEAEKEKECSAQYDSGNTNRIGNNNDNNKIITKNAKEEGLTKETANKISCSDNNSQSNICNDEHTKENTVDKECSNNKVENSNINKMETAHKSASSLSSPSLSWPKTMSEMTNAVKCIPTRTRVMTDNLEVEVFSHYLCSGVNPERKSYKSKAENVIRNNNEEKKSTNHNVECTKTTKAKEQKIEEAERQEQKSSNDEETSNTSDSTCKQNAELANKATCSSESAQQQQGKYNIASNNTSNIIKDNYSQKGSASSSSSSTSTTTRADANDSEGAEAVNFSEEMKRYALHSARNDNAHLFQITIVVRNMCDENEKEKPIYYQTLSHHFTFLNYHDHTSVETVGPGLCGNKVHLEPGNSHVFQTGAVVNGTDGVFRGTLQVIKIRKDGQMSTFDAVIAPTRLSVPEEMIEGAEASKANEQVSTEKENDSKMQPISADEFVEAQVGTLSEPITAITPSATSTTTTTTETNDNDNDDDDDNNKCDKNKKGQCINDDDAKQSTPNADIEQSSSAECKDVNLDITSTVTKLENSELKSSKDDKDSNNTITADTFKKEMDDVAEQATVQKDDDAAKECKEAEKNSNEPSTDSTAVTTESKSSDCANSEDATPPPHE